MSVIVGIVGATGAVGEELVKCLKAKEFPVRELRLFASAKSVGKTITTPYGDITIEQYKLEEVRNCELVFLAVSGEFALENAKDICSGAGPLVIDNSSAFRYDPDIPLVVPEINSHTMQGSNLIANPNCTTAIAAVVLHPLIREYGVRKIIVSSYQAASGAGTEGMIELEEGSRAKLAGLSVTNNTFVHPLPFNLIPQIDKFQSNGYTKEEMKVVWETLKIFSLDPADVRVSCTAVRVPILRAHSLSITIETIQPITATAARELLQQTPGVRLVDDPSTNSYPMPLTATGNDDVDVGRIRESLVFAPNGLDLFVCGDQLLRGAALNAVLIAKLRFPC